VMDRITEFAAVHESDVGTNATSRHVSAFEGKTGLDMLGLSSSHFDPMRSFNRWIEWQPNLCHRTV
jgi:hypothetical protein